MNNPNLQITQIENRITKKPFVIAIDGRCAAGKTTLAAQFAHKTNCAVIHADDFFLRPEQRSAERLQTPGENIDHERLLSEVLLPLQKGVPFSYRPFDCCTMGLKEAVWVMPSDITIVEGSYSCHPSLWDYYDLHVFVDIDKEEQLLRIQSRNPDKFDMFKNKWIPLEENYFAAYDVKTRCDLVIS